MSPIGFPDAVTHIAAHAVTYLLGCDLETASGFHDLDVSDQEASTLNAAREAVIHRLRELGNLPVATA